MSSIKRAKRDALRKVILVDNVKELEKDLRSDPKNYLSSIQNALYPGTSTRKIATPKISALDDENY